jgi:hypothetical protein
MVANPVQGVYTEYHGGEHLHDKWRWLRIQCRGYTREYHFTDIRRSGTKSKCRSRFNQSSYDRTIARSRDRSLYFRKKGDALPTAACICRDGAQKLVARQQRVQSQMRAHARTYVVVIHVEASHAILIVRCGDVPAHGATHGAKCLACVSQCTSGEQASTTAWCISQLRDSARAMRHAYSTCETVESELEEAHVQRCMWQHQL